MAARKPTRQETFWLSLGALAGGIVWLLCGYPEVGMALTAAGGFGVAATIRKK